MHVFTVVKSPKIMQFGQLSLDGPAIRVEIQGCRTVLGILRQLHLF